jgi:hypothetical protein
MEIALFDDGKLRHPGVKFKHNGRAYRVRITDEAKFMLSPWMEEYSRQRGFPHIVIYCHTHLAEDFTMRHTFWAFAGHKSRKWSIHDVATLRECLQQGAEELERAPITARY